MKRCPECRRDYNDDTLSYCLDDGMRLLDGPATRDEPKTLVFHPIEAQSNEPGTLAILPFRNLTGDDSVSFYEFSLADAVITELARLRSLAVCPSSVVAKYLQQARDPVEIGSELNVNAVLAASFLLAKSRMRVTTQLIHVRTGKILWGERIDADADDIITVQDTISQRIVDGLHLKLGSTQELELARKATDNSLAYEEYLRGRDRMRLYSYHTVSNEDIERAIGHFKRALDLDPKFALAHCALGSSYLLRVLKGLGTLDDIVSARESLDTGLSLDPYIFEARAYRAYIYFLENQHDEAYRQIGMLRDVAPHNSLVHFFSGVLYRQCGDYESSLNSFNAMLRVDPTAKVIVSYNRARIFMYQQRFDDALSELGHASELEPNHLFVRFFLGVALFRSGDLTKAISTFKELLRSEPRDIFRPYLAMSLAASGDQVAAREQITQGVEMVSATDADAAYWLASAYLLVGERDQAFEWLHRSILLGNSNRPWLEHNPLWKEVHKDTRFKNLMSQIRQRQVS